MISRAHSTVAWISEKERWGNLLLSAFRRNRRSSLFRRVPTFGCVALMESFCEMLSHEPLNGIAVP